MTKRRDQRLTLDQSKRISAARVLGEARTLPIYLSDGELARLVSIVLSDIGKNSLTFYAPSLPTSANGDYYNIPMEWFNEQDETHDFVELYLQCMENIPDFGTYFENLCELHKRRRKYGMILSTQPLPTMLQVAPRALLEYGIIATPALASWLMWRKWLYDIDNRAAQETGYLFEPILASALGGVRYAAQNSPIKRLSDDTKGRQVDCIVGNDAYEFKLRVTIAASGQGRFAEELAFAEDCQASGYTPILLVLDPTPSTRLDDLIAEFTHYGGYAYIGDAAWQHIENEAGATMATFVDRYIRRPIATLDEHADELLDLFIAIDHTHSTIKLQLGADDTAYQWDISHTTDTNLNEDE